MNQILIRHVTQQVRERTEILEQDNKFRFALHVDFIN
jgi:hypothetical protein